MVSKILLEESLELNPKQGIFGSLVLQLILVPSKAYPVIKEWSYKGCLIRTSNAGGIKMILTLLVEVVTLYVRFAIVEIRESSL